MSTSAWAGLELTALVVIGTNLLSSCMHKGCKYEYENFIKTRDFIHILVFIQDKLRCLSQKLAIVNTAAATRRANSYVSPSATLEWNIFGIFTISMDIITLEHCKAS
jgi:hypothetical protein